MDSLSQQQLDHASIFERGVAWFLDGLALLTIIFALLIPVLALGYGVFEGMSSEALEGVGVLFGLMVSTVYYAGAEAKWGATPGKMVLDLEVVYTDGRSCDGSGAILRNITKILTGGNLLAILVAIICIVATEENQRVGDIIGDTVVVRT